ncbi:type IV pilus twitching motility protein PilT [candidate division CSSED10-310 bacterium]|uniref:Type IV pilus twitching motility protein PilT n=1 Tax=candidate division CSSED10-310 bacterium TaxID=2855610 RepID=A0ABV6Z051_UNCC1
MQEDFGLPRLLKTMVGLKGTELHLITGSQPRFRVGEKLIPGDFAVMNADKTKELVLSVMTEQQKEKYEQDKLVHFSFGVKGLARFHAYAYYQRGAASMAIKVIPFKIFPLDDLEIPAKVQALATRSSGLIFISGPAGSGKTTTLAGFVDKINEDHEKLIMTVEDPIAYLHQHKKGLISQQEIYSDIESYPVALRAAWKQYPDVIVVGSVDDYETANELLRLAEAGFLCFAQLNVNSSVEVMNRILDLFPTSELSRVRTRLSLVLQGILCQKLVPGLDGKRKLALEVFLPTTAAHTLMRHNKISEIYYLMQAGQNIGSVTMNQSLHSLISQNHISEKEGLKASNDPLELMQMLEKI